MSQNLGIPLLVLLSLTLAKPHQAGPPPTLPLE